MDKISASLVYICLLGWELESVRFDIAVFMSLFVAEKCDAKLVTLDASQPTFSVVSELAK